MSWNLNNKVYAKVYGINKEMDEKNKDPDLKINDDECKIYTEIYEKYNSMYLKAINSLHFFLSVYLKYRSGKVI